MNKPVLFIFTILVVANIFSWFLFVNVRSSQDLMVDFFDVGQGDSIFIKTSEGNKIIIDGGPDYNKASEKLAEQLNFWDKEIDLMILSHPEQDHFTGLFKILKLYKVNNVVWTGDIKDTEGFKNFQLAIKQEQSEGAKIYNLDAGDRILIGKTEMHILFPFALSNQDAQSVNEKCLVVKLDFDKNSFLFTGDIGFDQEKLIISNQSNLDIDVLKVAHHGSKYSSSSEFLKAVSPEVSVIQVGKNSYGHPAVETLNRLIETGTKIFRNDLIGDIKIIYDGKNLKILSEN